MSERTVAADTTLEAERLQRQVWSRMTPAAKFAVFLDLQTAALAMAEAGIRARHPDADDREVFLRRVARMLDRDTMLRCYGWVPDQRRAP